MLSISSPSLRKVHCGTSERIVPASDTLSYIKPFLRSMGIARVGNLTGLDRIGVPVTLAVRPNSMSLSVAQGKGVDLDAALASGMMEAAETFHAEQVYPMVDAASVRELAKSERVVDWRALPQLSSKSFSEDSQISWVVGHDVRDGKEYFVPYDLVHTRYLWPPDERGGYFPLSSTGLASGNHLIEAVCSGLFELIERDAQTLWRYRTSADRRARRLRLETIRGASAVSVLKKVETAGLEVGIWNLTTDVGIAAFLCRIREPAPASLGLPFYGAGCHFDRQIAITRALTEAVQTRLTYIAGSRDDLERRNYIEAPSELLYRVLQNVWEGPSGETDFGKVPTTSTETLGEDLREIVIRLDRVGVTRILMIDLTRPEFKIPVVRVLAPGLEYDLDDPNAVPGGRAKKLQDHL